MAKAHQCDRCGKLYKKAVNYKPKFTINMHGYNWPFDDTDEIFDLCPDCQEKNRKIYYRRRSE